MIDDEVKMIVTEAHNEARRILLERRDVLETVTRRLLETEVMEGDELRQILEGHHVTAQIEAAHMTDQTANATAAPAAQSTA